MAVANAICVVVLGRTQALLERQDLTRGMEEDILDLSSKLLNIKTTLDVAGWRFFLDRSVKCWLKELEEILYDIDDVLEEWDLIILKLLKSPSEAKEKVVSSYIPLFCWFMFTKSATSRDIARKMKQLIARVDRILYLNDEFSTSYIFRVTKNDNSPPLEFPTSSFVFSDTIHGRELDMEALKRKIMVQGEREFIHVITVAGLPGIGKTALAQLIYNDREVMNHYQFRMWICVQRLHNLVSIVQCIIHRLFDRVPKELDVETLLAHLKDSLMGKRYLLVLDDVRDQNPDVWNPLKQCLNYGEEGSTILITTRNEWVARSMGAMEMYHLGPLSDRSCWLILSSMAQLERSKNQYKKFEAVCMEIAQKCKGIPHTAKVLGQILNSKCELEEWKNVQESEMWELGGLGTHIFSPLLSTYIELNPTLKCCFAYFRIIPKGCVVYAKKLIGCWFAEDYISFGRELHGRESLNQLAMQSLFQEVVQDEAGDTIMCKIHDIVLDCAHYLTKDSFDKGIGGLTCQACATSLHSGVKECRSMVFQQDPPTYICDCLKSLRVLSLRDCGLESIPRDMIKLIHLRLLDLSYNQGLSGEDLNPICELYFLETLFLSSCELQKMPMEIGDLIQLKHLDLSFNNCLTELPESICNLLELRTLELDGCDSLLELPQGIHRLRNLIHLHNLYTKYSCPQGLGQLTSLCTLNEFSGKLSLLKELNQLKGSLQLRIPESCGLEDVAEAKEAELDSKGLIKDLEIVFEEDISETISVHLLDALQPHRDLRYLKIELYGGPNLPDWIVSPFMDVRQIELQQCNGLLSLPALGKLPSLEELTVQEMDGLQCVGREFLGLTRRAVDIASSSSAIAANNVVAFPRLKVLIFYECPNWEEWEDITAEEHDSANVSIMPCLKKLDVVSCGCLEVLPHRLLRKAVELEELDIYNSDQLIELYEDKEGSHWNSITQIPQVRFV